MIRGGEKPPALPDVDGELVETLTRMFGVDYIKARKTAREQTYEAFSTHLGALENLIGPQNAATVVKGGDFLNYRNGTLEAYMGLAITVAGKLEYNPTQDQVPLFYSIESLQKYLQPKAEQKKGVDSGRLRLQELRLLQPDNPQSRGYLDSLVGYGRVAVGGHEHWSTSGDGQNGPRGLNIVRSIAYQLTRMFDMLGLGKPECTLNHGQQRLDISDKTRTVLEEVRTQVYNPKKS